MSIIAKELQNLLESTWGLIQRERNLYNGYYVNMKALKESTRIKDDIQRKTRVLFKEAKKVVVNKVKNPKDKQPFRFMHC